MVILFLIISTLSLSLRSSNSVIVGTEKRIGVPMETAEKSVMIVAMDESEHSFYALQWTLNHFFAPFSGTAPFKLVLVHAKPSPATAVGLAGPGINLIPIALLSFSCLLDFKLFDFVTFFVFYVEEYCLVLNFDFLPLILVFLRILLSNASSRISYLLDLMWRY